MTYTIFRLKPYTEKMGEIRPNGNVFSAEGVKVGFVSSEGEIKTADGVILGRINRGGQLQSSFFNSKLYKAGRQGVVLREGATVGKVKQGDKGVPVEWAQWAGCCFFLLDESDLLQMEDDQENKSDDQSEIETVRWVNNYHTSQDDLNEFSEFKCNQPTRKEAFQLDNQKLLDSLDLDDANFYFERRKLTFLESKKKKK